MNTKLDNMKHEPIGELEYAYKEGRICGETIANSILTSKNIEGLARYFIDAQNSHNNIIFNTAESFQEGFNKGSKYLAKKIPLAKKIKFSLKSIIFGYHAIKYNSELSKNMPDREYWNLN